MKMFCSKCGNALPEGAKFCSKCGNPVNENAGMPNVQTGHTEAKAPNRTSANAVGSNNWKMWLALASGTFCIIVVIAAVLLISSRSNSDRNRDSDPYIVQRDTSETPSQPEPSQENEDEDSLAEASSEETASTIYSFEDIALTGNERSNGLYDKDITAEHFSRVDSSNRFLIYYGWYDEDGFFSSLDEALRAIGAEVLYSVLGSSTAEQVFFFNPYAYAGSYKNPLYQVSIGQPYSQTWDYTGELISSIEQGFIFFKQGAENTIYLYPTQDSKEYLEIPYSFDPATNQLIFTLDNADFRFKPYMESSLYAEALSNFKNYCFANAGFSKWSANHDFKAYIENALDCTLNHASTFSYSNTHILSDDFRKGACKLNSSESNMATMVYFHWKQLDRNTVQFYESGDSVDVTFKISDDSLTLNIDGKTYSFKKL